jgi:hypothetical protein
MKIEIKTMPYYFNFENKVTIGFKEEALDLIISEEAVVSLVESYLKTKKIEIKLLK